MIRFDGFPLEPFRATGRIAGGEFFRRPRRPDRKRHFFFFGSFHAPSPAV